MNGAADETWVKRVLVVGEVGVLISEPVIDSTNCVRHHEGGAATTRHGSSVLTVGWCANVRIKTASAELVEEIARARGEPVIDDFIVLRFPIGHITVLTMLIAPSGGFGNEDAPVLGGDFVVESLRAFGAQWTSIEEGSMGAIREA